MARWISGMRRFRYSRRSTATCSLRDRPVCSRRPASPMRAMSSRSTNAWTSSSPCSGVTNAGVVDALLRESARSPSLDGRGVRRGEDAGPREPRRPRAAAPHVVFEQPPIEPERRSEREQLGVGIAGEPPGPQMRHQCTTVLGVGSSTCTPLSSSAIGERRPTTRQSPLNSFSRTAPVTRG